MLKLIQELFNNMNERVKNPFIGAFFISWFIFNWKPIAFWLFSNQNVLDKITTTELNYSDISNYLIYPLLMAFFYVLVFPFIMALLDFIGNIAIKLRNKERVNKRVDQIAGEKKIAKEIRKLREIEAGNDDYEELMKDISSLKNEINEYKKNNEELINELDSIAEILEFKGTVQEKMNIDVLGNIDVLEVNKSLGKEKIDLAYENLKSLFKNENYRISDQIIDELKRYNLITFDPPRNSYLITNLGKEFLLFSGEVKIKNFIDSQQLPF